MRARACVVANVNTSKLKQVIAKFAETNREKINNFVIKTWREIYPAQIIKSKGESTNTKINKKKYDLLSLKNNTFTCLKCTGPLHCQYYKIGGN